MNYRDVQYFIHRRYATHRKPVTSLSYGGPPSALRSLITKAEAYFDLDGIVLSHFKHKPKTPDMLDFFNDHLVFTEFKIEQNPKCQEIIRKGLEGFSALFHLIQLQNTSFTKADFASLKKRYYLVAEFTVFIPGQLPQSRVLQGKMRAHAERAKNEYRVLQGFYYDSFIVMDAFTYDDEFYNHASTP